MIKSCLFTLVLFKDYVHSIILGLGVIIIWGTILEIIPGKQLYNNSHLYILHVFIL